LHLNPDARNKIILHARIVLLARIPRRPSSTRALASILLTACRSKPLQPSIHDIEITLARFRRRRGRIVVPNRATVRALCIQGNFVIKKG
jgi:hypothetical protein